MSPKHATHKTIFLVFVYIFYHYFFTEILYASSGLVPIVGASTDRKRGVSIDIGVGFERRKDENGLKVLFLRGPSQFDYFIELPIENAIKVGAKIAGLEDDMRHWTVYLAVPNYGKGFKIYGTSCAPMITIAVLAKALGDPIPPNRVITGEMLSDGRIGPVRAIQLKLLSSETKFKSDLHPFERILVPIGNYEDVSLNPFLTDVIFVHTIEDAYFWLIGQPLKKKKTIS